MHLLFQLTQNTIFRKKILALPLLQLVIRPLKFSTCNRLEDKNIPKIPEEFISQRSAYVEWRLLMQAAVLLIKKWISHSIADSTGN